MIYFGVCMVTGLVIASPWVFYQIWAFIEPTLRISEWITFATILPLVFGVCFQTPLVMMLLERIGIFSAKIYRDKRRYAILIIVVIAAVITPTGDPFTLMLLAVPMALLYELGIFLVRNNVPRTTPWA